MSLAGRKMMAFCLDHGLSTSALFAAPREMGSVDVGISKQARSGESQLAFESRSRSESDGIQVQMIAGPKPLWSIKSKAIFFPDTLGLEMSRDAVHGENHNDGNRGGPKVENCADV